MPAHWKVVPALIIATALAGGCGSQAQEERVAQKEKTKADAPGVPSTTGSTGTKSADSPATTFPPDTTAPPDKDKEKRGNTPPGKDRAGSAPAAGAIVDPGGVTTK